MRVAAADLEPVAPLRATARRARLLLVLLVTGVALFRLSLLDRGTSAFVDETLYFTSVMAVQSLAAGDVQAAARAIAEARGRQGWAIAMLPAAALQAVPSAFGVQASNPRSLMIPASVNVLFSMVTLYLLYATSLHFTGNVTSSLVATLVHALLVNTNLYVRHLLPYEMALTAGMGAAWLLITRAHSRRLVVVAGALAATSVGFYTGNYLFACVVGAVLVLQAWRTQGWRHAVSRGLLFAAGAASVFLTLEAICRVGGVSYIASSRTLGRSIDMGSFEEGWTFLAEYLLRVEGVTGAVLLAAFGMWPIAAARRIVTTGARPIDLWLSVGTGAWIVQALLSTHFQAIVFYGRLIRPWMLLLSLALASSLAALPRGAGQRMAHAAVVAIGLTTFVPSAVEFRGLAYPSDVLYQLGIDTSHVVPDRFLCDFDQGRSYASPGAFNRDSHAPYSQESDYLLVNFCQDFAARRVRVATEFPGRPLLFDGQHWLTFPAYGYEGARRTARDAFVRERYRVRAFGPISVPVR